MPKPLAHYTEIARRDASTSVVAAIPVRSPESVHRSWTVAHVVAPVAVLAQVIAAMTIRRATFAKRPAIEQAMLFTLMMALHADSVTLHRRQRFGRQIGPAIERHPLVGVAYRRDGMAIETILTVDGTDWLVHGWFERDLRPILVQLGHTNAPEHA